MMRLVITPEVAILSDVDGREVDRLQCPDPFLFRPGRGLVKSLAHAERVARRRMVWSHTLAPEPK